MKKVTLIKPNGSTIELNSRSDKRSVSNAKVRKAIMGDDVLEISIVSVGAIDISIGDKIRAFGADYFVNTIPQVARQSKNVLSYVITLESIKYDLTKVLFINNYESSDPEEEKTVCTQVDFSVTGEFSVFMDKIMENLSRIYSEGVWSYEIAVESPDPEFKPDYQEAKTLTFSSANVLSALCSVCEEYGVEFYVGQDGHKKIIIGKTGTHHTNITFEYGKGNGLYSISGTSQSDKNIVTRLYAFGSSSNLGSKYRGGKKRLELPLTTYPDNYIQDIQAVQEYGIVESAVVFDDIFPSREGTVTGIESGKELLFYDSSMDFDINEKDAKGNSIYLIDQGGATIAFNSGKLAGYEFTLSAYNHTERRFTLLPFTDENDFTFPSKDDAAFQISKDDKYTILGISLPQSYVSVAELKLEEKALEKYKEYCRPSYSYALSIDEAFLKDKYLDMEQRDIFSPADYITIKDEELIKDQQRAVRVVGMTHDVLYPYKYELTLSDVVTPSVVTQLVKSTIKTDSIIKINKLDDVSRAKRNTRTTAQLRDMVFDADGYFNGGKIRPETIETLLLSVGAKSGEFVLSELVFNPNYGSNPNHIHSTEGHLIHYGIEENIRTWELMAATRQDLVAESAYYIYARCERSAGSSYAQILYSTQQWKFDSEEGWYLFLIGVLHSVSDGYRDISLTYGSTSINGRSISTGCIRSNNGDAYFDLDRGEIGGSILFTDQSAYVDENGNQTTIIDSGKINTQLLEVTHIEAQTGSIAQFDIAENKLTGKAGTIIFQNDEIPSLTELKQIGTVLNIDPPTPTPIHETKGMDEPTLTITNWASISQTVNRAGLVSFTAYGKGEFTIIPPDPNAYISNSHTKVRGYVLDSSDGSIVDTFEAPPATPLTRVSYLPKAGTYIVRIATEVSATTTWVEPQEKYPTATLTAHAEIRGVGTDNKIQFISLDKSTVIGTNGLFSIWSQQEYFYFASQQGLNVRGDIELYSPNGAKGLRITNDGIEGIGEVLAPQADWNATDASKGAIKNKPTSLPANGGNAATVGGKAASDFATSAQGTKADTAVQSATIGGVAVPKSGTTLQLPAYPTDADAVDGYHAAQMLPKLVYHSQNMLGRLFITDIVDTLNVQLTIDIVGNSYGSTGVNSVPIDTVIQAYQRSDTKVFTVAKQLNNGYPLTGIQLLTVGGFFALFIPYQNNASMSYAIKIYVPSQEMYPTITSIVATDTPESDNSITPFTITAPVNSWHSLNLPQAAADRAAIAATGATLGGTTVAKAADGTLLLPSYPTSLPANGGNAATSDKSTTTNHLEAYLNDDFTLGDHYVKAIRLAADRWDIKLLACYKDGAQRNDSISVNHANKSDNAAKLGGFTSSYFKAYTDDKINDIKIGGVNILPNSKELLFGTATHGYDYKPLIPTQQIAPNTQYYFSSKIEILAGNPTSVTLVFYDKNVTSVGGRATLDIVNGQISGIISSNSDTEIYYMLIYNGLDGSTTGNSIKLSNLKLEKGNKPTSWTPALEDTQADIDDRLSKSQTTDQITNNIIRANDFVLNGATTFALSEALESDDNHSGSFYDLVENARNKSYFEQTNIAPAKDIRSLNSWRDYSPYVQVIAMQGTVNGVEGTVDIIPRQSVTLSANIVPGTTFERWEKSLYAQLGDEWETVSTKPVFDYFIERASTFRAVLTTIPMRTIDSYRLFGGTFTVNGDTPPTSAPEGSVVTVTAKPAVGMQVSAWYISFDAGQTESLYIEAPIIGQGTMEFTYLISKDVWFRPTFVPSKITITVTSANTDQGTVSGSGEYNANATANISATPKAGYLFRKWSRNGIVTGLSQSFSYQVTQPDNWTAYFLAIPKYEYSVSGGIQGAQLFISLTKPVTYPTQGIDTNIEAYAGDMLYLFTAPSAGVVENPTTWEIYDQNTDEVIASGNWASSPISAQTTVTAPEFGGSWAIREINRNKIIQNK